VFVLLPERSVVQLSVLFAHDEETGQEQLDRRGHIQTHGREEHSTQSDIRVRGQRMDRVAGS